MSEHHEHTGATDRTQVTLRGPAELADALPYVLGYHPTDSVVLVALHGSRGAFGGRVRLGIPRSPAEWRPVARQLAECLIEGSRARGDQPDGVALFLCQDPGSEESGRAVMERLRPLSHWLRTACGALDVPVYEALCISGGRFWSYCCPDPRCCPPEGHRLAASGTSVMAAAAAYAGVQVRGSLRDMEVRLAPWTGTRAAEQERALDRAAAALVPRILDREGRVRVTEETIALARALLERLAAAVRPPRGLVGPDAADDALVGQDEAAALILGLQDRVTRDRAAEWMEGSEGEPALRLWRVLSRRCVGPYAEHAAAPLTLAGWVSWSLGDQPAARVALGLALSRDPEYVFALLLHQACNAGLEPEAVRGVLREERAARETAVHRPGGPPDRPAPRARAPLRPVARTGRGAARPPRSGPAPGTPGRSAGARRRGADRAGTGEGGGSGAPG
ncbi:DUF4192 domain-containing protein [Streptomyces clavuligerus]|uniref:DUF4192 domain-containing protein n=1 Tax=Streptomyces clavuligerus TaxID=1901 RepID=E2QA67_STRCL|nr:DUF4192 domain-containing protein [Streptomyces clavuligerus]ANW17706.1 hypothetical protein BB341_05435 [Streptomyces clavuligerus]AXU12255.1 DUF4192 domain-containing protein [Streptomyces clavuligerus]EFG09766.1 Hypothetical protein SCLAV_4694 [Streptomyces clavuligerus]MBY6302132.1 DUF4192 domain-containing protein [Streptomyces clavuligerus]QCS05036.1 DUF4192 domain-containing protein [Streptomyces clavuligerus]